MPPQVRFVRPCWIQKRVCKGGSISAFAVSHD